MEWLDDRDPRGRDPGRGLRELVHTCGNPTSTRPRLGGDVVPPARPSGRRAGWARRTRSRPPRRRAVRTTGSRGRSRPGSSPRAIERSSPANPSSSDRDDLTLARAAPGSRARRRPSGRRPARSLPPPRRAPRGTRRGCRPALPGPPSRRGSESDRPPRRSTFAGGPPVRIPQSANGGGRMSHLDETDGLGRHLRLQRGAMAAARPGRRVGDEPVAGPAGDRGRHRRQRGPSRSGASGAGASERPRERRAAGSLGRPEHGLASGVRGCRRLPRRRRRRRRRLARGAVGGLSRPGRRRRRRLDPPAVGDIRAAVAP